MKKSILFLVVLVLGAYGSKGQKVFQMGTQKQKMEAAANQAELIWVKDKKTYILCPEKPISGIRKGKRCLLVFDQKGKREDLKKVSIENDSKKLHEIEKVAWINSKVLCFHSFYDKSEKKYTLYQTTLAESDGQPEGLGRDVLTLETKNPDVIEGMELVFSNDSSKMMLLVYENASGSKNQKLILHCLIFNKEDFSFERDMPFTLDMNAKGFIRAKAAISNQSTVYVVGGLYSKKAGDLWNVNMNIYFRDNEDNQQSIEMPKNDMKLPNIFDCKFDRKERLVMAGTYTNKPNIESQSGTFLYILDIAKNEFLATGIFDNDDDMADVLKKQQPKEFTKYILRPAKFDLYVDQGNNYFLVGQQYKDPKDYNAELKQTFLVKPDLRTEYHSVFVALGNYKGELVWQKGITGQIMYTLWDMNRINIIDQEDREIRLETIGLDKKIKYTKGAAPTEPDHKIDARCICPVGDGKVAAIGHALAGSSGFYLDYFDFTTIDVKGKIEVIKKKK